MNSIGSRLQSPEAPQPSSDPPGRLRAIEEHGAQYLELRTEAGTVYVCPSRLQRIRLQWAFRHFRVLPPQVLSRRDQRLIDKLAHSAVVKPALPLTREDVFGVVEKMRSQAVGLKADSAATIQAVPAKTGIPRLPGPRQKKMKQEPRTSGSWDPGFNQWRALGALAAVCFAVILASGYTTVSFSGLSPRTNPPTLSTPVNRAANALKPADVPPAATPLRVLPVIVTVASAEKTKRVAFAAPKPSPVPPQPQEESARSLRAGSTNPSPIPALVPALAPMPALTSVPSELRFISELPPGHFAHPLVSDPNLVGELQMKALIGADGSVKEVTVLSGSPKLGEAGMRAVRQWHYNPYQVLGTPVEVETQIKMNFFGEDAVSVASVANGSTSQPK